MAQRVDAVGQPEVTLWVRAPIDGPQEAGWAKESTGVAVDAILSETDSLEGCFVSMDYAGVGTGIMCVIVRGPVPANQGVVPVRLYAARIFNEFGCDAWTEAPVECACKGAGCEHCAEATSTGRPGIVTPSLGDDFFYPAGGGA